jgi:hypothetical protein
VLGRWLRRDGATVDCDFHAEAVGFAGPREVGPGICGCEGNLGVRHVLGKRSSAASRLRGKRYGNSLGQLSGLAPVGQAFGCSQQRQGTLMLLAAYASKGRSARGRDLIFSVPKPENERGGGECCHDPSGSGHLFALVARRSK